MYLACKNGVDFGRAGVECYGQNVCFLPQIHILKTLFQCDGEEVGPSVGRFMNRISALIKRLQHPLARSAT